MAITITSMTALYNSLVPADKQIKKFADKAKAEARLDALCDELNLVWYDAEDGTGLAVYTPEEEPTEPDFAAENLEAMLVPLPSERNSVDMSEGPELTAPVTRATHTRQTHPDTAIIIMVVATSPKRPGTKAHARFALYRVGMTVRAALDAGITRQDLRWDTEHNLITIAPC